MFMIQREGKLWLPPREIKGKSGKTKVRESEREEGEKKREKERDCPFPLRSIYRQTRRIVCVEC